MEPNLIHECKNCSTEVDGQFCSFCGQRYHAHKESFGELAYEFISDFWHFDSRFFKTILPLMFSPGKLTKSYNEGKQRNQFHPIRLYFFSSFVYFFLFFAFNNVENKFEPVAGENPLSLQNDSTRLITQSEKSASISKSITDVVSKNDSSVSKQGIHLSIAKRESASLHEATFSSYLDSLLLNRISPAKYIEQQKSLLPERKDGYFSRILILKLLKINQIDKEGEKEFFKKLNETFFHNIPKLLFFLLPVFALILKLLYVRKKEFYYVDHAVLSLHFFSLIFILLVLCNYILNNIFGTTFFTTLAIFYIIIYLLLAMKKLYRESWKVTILKQFTLVILFTIAVAFTLFINLAVTALSI